MPSIAGIDLSDGIKILLGNDRLGVQVTPAWYRHADLEAYLTGPPAHTVAEAEDAAGKFLTNLLQSDQVKIHIFTVSPLKYTCIVANKIAEDGTPYVIPDNWWEQP